MKNPKHRTVTIDNQMMVIKVDASFVKHPEKLLKNMVAYRNKVFGEIYDVKTKVIRMLPSNYPHLSKSVFISIGHFQVEIFYDRKESLYIFKVRNHSDRGYFLNQVSGLGKGIEEEEKVAYTEIVVLKMPMLIFDNIIYVDNQKVELDDDCYYSIRDVDSSVMQLFDKDWWVDENVNSDVGLVDQYLELRNKDYWFANPAMLVFRSMLFNPLSVTINK